MNKILLIIFIVLTPGLCAEEFQVVEREAPYILTVRGQSKALKSHGLMTPGNWLPLSSIVADGSYVNKGDVVAKFDSTAAEYEYRTMLFDKQVIEQQLKYELTEIDNDRLGKNDKFEAFVDTLKIHQAILDKMRSLPLKDEIRKAQGQLNIARLQYEAALKEYTLAESRFKKEYISKRELTQKSQELKASKASLEYAIAFLDYQKLPAKKGDLKIQEINVVMAQQEVEKIKYEISQLSTLQAYEKQTANRKKAIIQKRLKRQKKNIDNTIVKAPVSGYVKHADGRQKLGPGVKFWREYRFVDIPDISSLVFESTLPEAKRKFFKLNDLVEIYVSGRKEKPVKGFISQISGVPIDLGEKGKRRYGSKVKLMGIKIYQMQVKILKYENWMVPGMNGDIKISSSNPIKLPAVPVKYLNIKDGKNYLSIAGVYQKVIGFTNQGWFMVETPNFTAKSVQLDGVFPEEKKQESKISRFMASGEVLPVTSTKVIVPDLYGEAKITWLKKEESHVKKGDVLIKMSSAEIDKKISEIETEKADLVNSGKTLQKKLSIQQKENLFELKNKELLVQIRKIEMDVLNNEIDKKSIINARLQWLKAKITYENSLADLNRLQNKSKEFVSGTEVEKAVRVEKRRKLQLESVLLNYEDIKKGAKEIQKEYGALRYFQEKVAYEKLVATLRFKERKNLKRIKSSNQRLEWIETDLKYRMSLKDNLVIKAPADGMIRYGKVYDNGVIDKITIGTGLRERMSAMTIPNVSELYIRIEIPERYYQKVSEGQKIEVRIPAIGNLTYSGEVNSIEYIFKSVSRQSSQLGIYSSQEPLGETVFMARISIDLKGQSIKPGVVADVYFPFLRY